MGKVMGMTTEEAAVLLRLERKNVLSTTDLP